MAKIMERNKNMSIFFKHHLIPVNNDTGELQELEEPGKNLQVDA